MEKSSCIILVLRACVIMKINSQELLSKQHNNIQDLTVDI